MSELAAGDGIRTPRLLGVAEVDADRLALAFVRINGARWTASRPSGSPTRSSGVPGLVADRIGRDRPPRPAPVRSLPRRQRQGLADRLPDSGPWPRAQQLAGDVAELLCSMAVAVDTLTVDAAVAELREQIQALPPGPDALSSATRKAMKADKGLGKQLQDTAAAAVGVEKITFQRLERVQPRHVLTLLATRRLPTSSSTRSPRHVTCRPSSRPDGLELGHPGPGRLGLTYAGAGLNLVGGFAQRLSLVDDNGPRSFINRITPVKVGGMAVNVTICRSRGSTRRPPSAGWGSPRWRQGRPSPSPPCSWCGPAPRQTSSSFLKQHHPAGPGHRGRGHRPGHGGPTGPATAPHGGRPQVEKAAHELREALQDPARLSLSFLGALLMDLAYIAALFASVRAFHYPVTFAVAGAVYLTGTVVALRRPNPRRGRSGGGRPDRRPHRHRRPQRAGGPSRPDLPGGYVLVARAPGLAGLHPA